ncbi:hypothetical protein Sjap_026124 [Stephania japonica]|uniref:Leucine-rich repeat-containing N-terminal plant-type domain-containing protein n=1 Tax=Stephania japonica TaxID=461633 RepID=A0AAP0E636_9MAGN
MRTVLHHLFSPNSFPIMMRFNIMFSCLVISVLCFLLLCNSSWAVEGQCLDEQRHLLLHLKHNLSFSSSSEYGVPVGLSSWDFNTDCCRSWEGVECNQIGEVIGLDLSDKSIVGSTDELASLFHLSHLQGLNLGHNYFNSAIPSGFDRLPHLTHLDLSNSYFVGQIPIGISRLMRLVSLDLSAFITRENDLLKLENPNLRMLVGNLSELRELRLDGVNISLDKERNEWAQILSSSLPKLQVLSFFNCSLSGSFHSSLSKLHSLTELGLSLNNFSAEIPEFFGSFSNLTVLELVDCGLKGNVPQRIFTLPKLQYLDLSDNPLLEGSLPEFSQDNSLQYLSTLDLSSCRFNGPIPASLFALPSLMILDLSYNQFSGHLDESTFESPPQIEKLDLGGNKLEGPIPLSIFHISSLVHVYLNSNQFNGTLELNRFEALTNLSVLDLSENLLSIDTNNINSALFPKVSTLWLCSCNLRVFPNFLQNQSRLIDLDLSSNNIGGNLPSWIDNIGNGLVFQLNLSNNSLENPIQPFSNNSFRELKYLDLHSNLFSGPLPILPPSAISLDYSKNNCSFMPSNISSFLSYAAFFSLASNNVHGQLPESLCSVGRLQVLDLSNNSLSGSIQSCIEGMGGGLKVLNLQRNRLSSTMNASLPKDCALRTFDLNGNQLEGQLSSSLGYCTMLEVINLGNNQFTGTFPHWLGNLATLRILVLRSNYFYGPVGVPQPGYRFPKLQIVDISSNRFSGKLSFEWIKLWDLMRNDKHETGLSLGYSTFSYYRDEVTVTSKGLEIEYVKILTILTLVDLSNNAFEGAIPKEIGELKALCILNLSRNALTGPIPSSIGNLKQLESFDLSQNQ